MLGEPEGASSTGLDTWLLLKLDLPLFESFYRRVGGEIVYTGASFGKYDDGDSSTTDDTAMTRNGELNGPRRYIFDGYIYTRTYKDNRDHGLYIKV